MTEGGRGPCTELIEALLENSESLPVPGRVADGDASAIQARLELLGRTLWDVFSNNHTVLDSEGNACDLGSFRGSARFIAEAIRRARRKPLPPVVAAYRDVYGRPPEGWPHPDM